MSGRYRHRLPRALGSGALLLVLVAWVLPPERVVRELVRVRTGQVPVRAEAILIGGDPRWPEELRFELHPDYGVRISGDRGGRWLFIGGRPAGRASETPPAWLPDLAGLLLRDEAGLLAWLEGLGVDPERSQFARCGDDDCFVLGGRNGEGQVWVDKQRFEIRRVVRPGGRILELSTYTNWDGLRFPGTLRLEGPAGPIATIEVIRAEPARGLGAEDFTLEWLRGPEAERRRP